MNQYGPFRIGPAYPFTFGGPMVAPLLAGRPAPVDACHFPYPPKATHTLQWMCNLNYDGKHNGGATDGVEDGCRIVGRSLQVGPGVNGVTVRGEGQAFLDAKIRLAGATNVVVRNVHVPGGCVSSEGCGSVRIDLCPERPFVDGGADAAAELKRLDKALEWADQHAEREKVERMYDDLKKLRRIVNQR